MRYSVKPPRPSSIPNCLHWLHTCEQKEQRNTHTPTHRKPNTPHPKTSLRHMSQHLGRAPDSERAAPETRTQRAKRPETKKKPLGENRSHWALQFHRHRWDVRVGHTCPFDPNFCNPTTAQLFIFHCYCQGGLYVKKKKTEKILTHPTSE